MLEQNDFYFDDGLLVFTEHYHRKRGSCCGNGCRHCPFSHAAVPERSTVEARATEPSSGEPRPE